MNKKVVTAILTATMVAATISSGSMASEKKTNLVFWTGLAGQAGEVIQQVVDNYNSSQDRVYVELQYQGSYQESLNKLKTSMRTQDGPDLVQIYEAGTRQMIDSNFIIPMQEIIEKYDGANFGVV